VLTAQIEGVTRNDGSAKLEYAEVIGKFYNQDGTLLATGVARTVSEEGQSFPLDPGQIWEFTISYSSAAREAHPALTILSYYLEKDSSEAKIVGQAQNDGDVILSFAQITGNFYREEPRRSLTILSCELEKDFFPKAVGDVQNDGNVRLSSAEITATFYKAGTEVAKEITTILDLEVGEIRDYEISYEGSGYATVDQVTAKITSTEYEEVDTLLASSTASTTDLEVGETWDFSILYPKENYEEVDNVTVEVADEETDIDYEPVPTQEVDHVTVKVGTLKGSTVMP